MSSLRDHAATARWHLANGRVRVSDAWYRAVGWHVRSARAGYSNFKNRRTIERGKAPRRDRVAAEVKSRIPVYRNRVNPAHGNKHREDARLHHAGNESLRRMKEQRPVAARSQLGPQREARAEPGDARKRAQHSRARLYAMQRRTDRTGRSR